MRVFLLNPPGYPNTTVNRELMGGYGTISTSPMILPPLNIAYIAACLKKEYHEINIYDAIALKSNPSEVLRSIVQFKPDIVGINTSTATIKIDLAMVDAVKEKMKIPVFVVGSHVSILPNYIFENSTSDFVIRDEPELTSVELLRQITAGIFKGIKGLSYRRDGSIFHNEDREKISNLDLLPFPARDLLPLTRYYMPSLSKPFTTILTSRGCFFKCSYCPYYISQGVEVRRRSPRNVFEEIKEVYHLYGIKNLTFRDAIFTFHKDFVIQLCELIIKSKLHIDWTCETAVRFLDEELLCTMKRAGCRHISVGLESGNEFLQNKYSKNKIKSKVHAKQVFAVCRKLKISTRGFFMIGYPEETKQMINETVDFAIMSDPDTVQFTAVTPYPGTELYNILKNQNQISFGDMTGYRPHNINHYMSVKELRKQIMRAYLKFYLRPTKLLRTIADPMMFKQKVYRCFTYNRS